jgi:hypothetical protein
MTNNWNNMVCLASGRSEMGADFGWNPFKAIRKVGKTLGGAISSVSSQIKKVPVVGVGLNAVYSVATSPVTLTANIAAGHNVGKALVRHLKDQVTAVKDIAPYVQTIISFVPGIGTTASGVISAATAIARGRPISEAVIDGVKNSLPGGPVAKAAFDVAISVSQGKDPSEAALSAIPLPPDQRKAVIAAVMATKDIASGKPVDSAIFERGKNFLPPDAQKALTTGMAMAQAKNIQSAMKIGAKSAVPNLLKVGSAKLSTDSVLKAGADTLTGEVKRGFIAGSGMVGFKFSPIELNSVRGSLPPEAKKGFDIALSTHVGRITKPLPQKLDNKVKFGYYTAMGMRGAAPKNELAMKTTLAKDSKVLHGIIGAKKTREKEKSLKHLTIWDRIKYLITGR